MKKWTTGVVLALFISLAWAPGASATDGHFLHGVGAINSAMGGVGVAGAKDVLGALYHNPAGLMAFEGHHAAISLELFKPDRTLTATAPTQQGLFTGSQTSKSDFVPIPAFGWSTELNGRQARHRLRRAGCRRLRRGLRPEQHAPPPWPPRPWAASDRCTATSPC